MSKVIGAFIAALIVILIVVAVLVYFLYMKPRNISFSTMFVKAKYANSGITVPSKQEELMQQCTALGVAPCTSDALATEKLRRLSAQNNLDKAINNWCSTNVPGSFWGRLLSKKWGCYTEPDLDLSDKGKYCTDIYGNPAECYGKPKTKRADKTSSIQEIIDRNKQISKAQNAIDAYCMENAAPGSGKTYYGRAGKAPTDLKEYWRCYAADALDFNKKSNVCVNASGKRVDCYGVWNGTSTEIINKNSELKGVIAKNRGA